MSNNKSTFNPKGSICVVTGGANGIGKALCIHLANLGAKKVIVVDLDIQSSRTVVQNDLPPGVGIAMKANCGQERDIRHIINRTESECGNIDAFFCNAGILSTGGVEVSNDEWQQIWDVNVLQSLYVARHLMPRYEERKKGLLVITSSAAGLLSMPGALPYAVTKHASVAMAEWLAFTYASKGIQVACLCPQAVRTHMTAVGDGDGGPAGLDGVLEADQVAKETLETVAKGNFLILPHRDVPKHMLRKAKDYDKFLKAMGKIHAKFGEKFANVPPNSRL
jgi:NAD(P)-dependent dehydrogenase (short-subunit alcohol dehydrogenase family)